VRIRRVDIDNFRGIKRLRWVIPSGQDFLVLIGPGDSTKSTLLTAVDMALSERWSLSLSDTDFYAGSTEEPISIRVTLADLSVDLLRNDVLGMELCGLGPDGDIRQDPHDDCESCFVVELRIDQDLEPKWLAYRPDLPTSSLAQISARVRRNFAAYKVDERIDAHLRWSRTSALGRMTEAKHGASGTLAAATRASRTAVTESIKEPLAELTKSVQDKLHELGSGSFQDLRPGLDTSLANSSGNLALFEGDIPLTSFGLGSRRLAGIATQQIAYEGKALLLVDEVEYGLEPHRLVHLLGQLRKSGSYSQVLVTTHSPTTLQHIDAENLAVVRSDGEETSVRVLARGDELQPALRSAPEAFLARRILVAEGKTDYGFALELLGTWDALRVAEGLPPSSALGVVAVEGHGGTQAVTLARGLMSAGYEATLLLDSDDAVVNAKAGEAQQQGASVVRWQDGFNIERQVCELLDESGLSGLLALAVELSGSAAASYIPQQLRELGAPVDGTTLDVLPWLSDSSLTIEQARDLIAKTAHKRDWFKLVDKGRALAKFALANGELDGAIFSARLEELRAAIYEPRPRAGTETPREP
jgi:putative ATP-dependent endonuclease of OLD family